jgi:hypothetical protein
MAQFVNLATMHESLQASLKDYHVSEYSGKAFKDLAVGERERGRGEEGKSQQRLV